MQHDCNQVCIKEANESEPLLKHRKTDNDIKTAMYPKLRDKHGGRPIFWLCGVRCLEGATFIQAFLRNRRSSSAMVTERYKRKTLKTDSRNVHYCGGLQHSSEEVSVMEMERRL